MKKSIPISLTPTLIGKSFELLQSEQMDCHITQAGLAGLAKQLVNYKEEGKSLFPEIYIVDDVEFVMKILPFSQHYYIGNGEKTLSTMLTALKKCAPLTEGGWAIFINRNDDSFDYGVFRAGTSMLSVSISETLIEVNDANEEDVKVILLRQVSEKLIEISGIRSNPLLISFGASEEHENSPIENQAEFIKSIIANVPIEFKEQASSFYRKIFDDVLKNGHGTLACVISSTKDLPKRLHDGITLDKKIDITGLISDLLNNNDLKASSELAGAFSLITGMMKSDGITVFTDKGEVACYNVFIKHPKKIATTNTSGGARSRTFLTLKSWIGVGIRAAYIQSQDGKIEFANDGK